jgi:hypothetical protein
MAKELSNIFIIVPLSVKENHLFLANGLIKEDEVQNLKNLVSSKGYLVIITQENEIDWFNHFWNNKIEENKVNSYHQLTYKGEIFKDNETIFNQIFGFEESIFKLFSFNFTILLKDISQINSFLIDISNKVEIVWENFDKYDKQINAPSNEWLMTNISFLNDLFYKKYKRVCYLILNDEQNEDEYNVINQNFRSEQNLLIVELDNEDKLSTILKFRIRVIRQINNHNYYFFEENTVEILNEFSVLIFANYANYEKKYDELFMIRAEDLKYLNKILNNIHEKYCYKWIDEDYFIASHKNKAFEEVPNSLWKEKNVFGIIIKEHDFHQRQSDFGSDNKFIVAFGDSKYPALRKLHPLEVWHYPRGFSSDSGKYFYDYYFFDTNMYTYFYQNKKLLLFNFDDVPYIDKVNRYYTGCIVDSIEKLSALKVIRIPKFLLEDSFVLTTNWEENN